MNQSNKGTIKATDANNCGTGISTSSVSTLSQKNDNLIFFYIIFTNNRDIALVDEIHPNLRQHIIKI